MKHLRTVKPYIDVLKDKNDKIRMLNAFPPHVIDAIFEIIVNIIRGNVKVSTKQRQTLIKYKKHLMQILNSVEVRKKNRWLLYYQKGGFISAVIPVLASVLGGILGSTL